MSVTYLWFNLGYTSTFSYFLTSLLSLTDMYRSIYLYSKHFQNMKVRLIYARCVCNRFALW